MHLVVIGLNYRTAPLEVRERASIDASMLPGALSALTGTGVVKECLILSTCNRTEAYACTPSREDDGAIVASLAGVCGLNPESIGPHLYSYAGHKAAEHLFRVASGIDSMVIGEAQVLGQVKEAFAAASSLGHTGSILNPLFQQALEVGKRARTETEISRGAFSVGSVAVQVAKSIFEGLDGRTVLIIGSGKMAGLMITHLCSCATGRILVSNRTFEKAEGLARQFSGRPIEFDDIPGVLETADIVISSTGSRKPVISKDTVSRAMRARHEKPMFFIDIAVPRDIEPGVQDLDNVFVYNIDDLQSAVQSDASNREREIARVEEIISEEVAKFMGWWRTLDVVPVVTALRDKLEAIRSAEIEKLRRKHPDLPPDVFEAIEAASRSIVNRISHDPLIRIKDYASGEGLSEKLQTVCEVFGISSDAADDGTNSGEGNDG